MPSEREEFGCLRQNPERRSFVLEPAGRSSETCPNLWKHLTVRAVEACEAPAEVSNNSFVVVHKARYDSYREFPHSFVYGLGLWV